MLFGSEKADSTSAVWGLGSWGVAVGNFLIYLTVRWKLTVFGCFNALLVTTGRAVYSTAQSLVLYSRLQLVVRSIEIQGYVLITIASTIVAFVIPTRVVAWPAYNTWDHQTSSIWLPRNAIVKRSTR